MIRDKISKLKIPIWFKLFLSINLLLLILTIFSYFYIIYLINNQFGIFLIKSISKERLEFLEKVKIILEDFDKNFFIKINKDLNIKSNNNIRNIIDREKIFKELSNNMNETISKYSFIVSFDVYLNRYLLFRYDNNMVLKKNKNLVPPPHPIEFDNPPPPLDLNIPPQYERKVKLIINYLINFQNKIYPYQENIKPMKLANNLFMEIFLYRFSENRNYILKIIIFNEDANKFLKTIRNYFIIFYLVLIFISFLASYLISKNFSTPIRKITEGTIKLSNGDYNVKIDLKRNDEFGLMIENFNNLALKLKKDNEFTKLIITNITHDISTPINIIKSYLHGIKDGVIALSDKNINDIDSEVERINELVDQFNIFYLIENKNKEEKINKDNLEKLNLSFESEIYIEKIFNFFKSEKIIINKNIEKDIYFKIKRNHFRSIVENLLKNSIIHNLSNEKLIEFYLLNIEKKNPNLENFIYDLLFEDRVFLINSSSILQKENFYKEFIEKKKICLIIKDNGLGIYEDDIFKIFDSNYKGKNTNSKLSKGYGLYIVKRIMEFYDFYLAINTKVDKGSIFFVLI